MREVTLLLPPGGSVGAGVSHNIQYLGAVSLPCPEQPWSWTISFSHAVDSIIPGNGLLTRVNTIFTTHQSPFYLLWRIKNISSSTNVVYKTDPIHSSIKLSLQMFRRRETLKQWVVNSATGARRTAGDIVFEGQDSELEKHQMMRMDLM